MKTQKTILRELLLTFSAVGITTSISFAATKMMSKFLIKEEFAIVVLAYTIQSFFNLLISGPYLNAFSRFFHEYDPKDKLSIHNISQNLATLYLRSTAWLAIIIVGISASLRSSLNYNMTPIVYGVLLAGLQGYFDIHTNFYTARRQRLQALVSQVAMASTKLIACLPLIFGNLRSGWVVLVTLVISGGVITKWRSRQTKSTFHLDKLGIREIYSSDSFQRAGVYASPFILWSLSQWLFTASDKWTLQYLHRPDLVADLAIITTIFIAPFNILGSTIQSFLMPIFYEKIGLNQKPPKSYFFKTTILSCVLMLFFSTPLIVLYWINPEYILTLLSDSKYLNVSPFVIVFACGAVMLNLGQLLCSPLLLEDRLTMLAILKNSSMLLGAILVFCAAWSQDLGRIGASQFFTGIYFCVIAFCMNLRIAYGKNSRGNDVGRL